jgi:hypothetical protein
MNFDRSTSGTAKLSIDLDNGDLYINKVLCAIDTESAFLNSIKQASWAVKKLENNGYRSYSFDAILSKKLFGLSIIFFEEKNYSQGISLATYDDRCSRKGWDSTTDEMFADKEDQNSFLMQYLSAPITRSEDHTDYFDYSWGSIASSCSLQMMTATISITWRKLKSPVIS